MTVYVVTEEEPETNTEFPLIVLGVYESWASANARISEARKAHDLEDDDDYMEADITWNIEEHEVQP